MTDDELELLITLDDPGAPPEEDAFSHLQINNFEYWLGQRFLAWCRLNQEAEGVSADAAYKVTFGQGDWTCTLSNLNSPNEVCTVIHRKDGEIVEQKQFYDVAGMPKQISAG